MNTIESCKSMMFFDSNDVMLFLLEICLGVSGGGKNITLNKWKYGRGVQGWWTWCVSKRRSQTLLSLSFDVLPYVKDVIPIDNNKKDVYILDKLYRLGIGRIIFLICPRLHLVGFFRRWYKNMFNKKECLLKMNKWTKMGYRYV